MATPQSPAPGEEAQSRRFALFLPLMFGLPTSADAGLQPGENRTTVGEQVVLINSFIGSLVVIQGSENAGGLSKGGPLPASKAAIEALPVVKITEEEEEESECAICLAEYEVGGEAKEMPCKHRFHPGCIEKWLGIHGSCPVCRFMMPVEERNDRKGGEGGEGNGGEIRISFFFGGHGGDSRDSDSNSAADSGSN
ncbi:E3 ubiquitin-protein ligase MPSR1-like [Diospyros lotus]|uniref:E3 ubiquitin-protein ligase MPSR1-like n=1 Tax=Diospyros lotus TaxID=55363 RepID=UPI0022572212|nr:E3 ubiquitin-protein ligase MPSR1-like [Diospyros lotus]